MARGGNNGRAVGGGCQAQNAAFVRRKRHRDRLGFDTAVFLFEDIVDMESVTHQAEILTKRQGERAFLVGKVEDTDGGEACKGLGDRKPHGQELVLHPIITQITGVSIDRRQGKAVICHVLIGQNAQIVTDRHRQTEERYQRDPCALFKRRGVKLIADHHIVGVAVDHGVMQGIEMAKALGRALKGIPGKHVLADARAVKDIGGKQNGAVCRTRAGHHVKILAHRIAHDLNGFVHRAPRPLLSVHFVKADVTDRQGKRQAIPLQRAVAHRRHLLCRRDQVFLAPGGVRIVKGIFAVPIRLVAQDGLGMLVNKRGRAWLVRKANPQGGDKPHARKAVGKIGKAVGITVGERVKDVNTARRFRKVRFVLPFPVYPKGICAVIVQLILHNDGIVKDHLLGGIKLHGIPGHPSRRRGGEGGMLVDGLVGNREQIVEYTALDREIDRSVGQREGVGIPVKIKAEGKPLRCFSKANIAHHHGRAAFAVKDRVIAVRGRRTKRRAQTDALAPDARGKAVRKRILGRTDSARKHEGGGIAAVIRRNQNAVLLGKDLEADRFLIGV